MLRLGVVGYGAVGRALAGWFGRHYPVQIYDKYLPHFASTHHANAINECDLVFVCVPTPLGKDLAIDDSAVRECANWISAPMCIRSTVLPGTTDQLITATGKAIVFSPEFIGELPNHPWREEDACGFSIVGGDEHLAGRVFKAYHPLVSTGFRFVHTKSPAAAELCKYMVNCYLASKVGFVNQFYDIARQFDVDFDELRKLWLLDTRIGESHSIATPERGFGGNCLPKDLQALITVMRSGGGAPLLEALSAYNASIRQPEYSARNLRKIASVKLDKTPDSDRLE